MTLEERVAALEAWRAEQEQRRERARKRHRRIGIVFTNVEGTSLEGSTRAHTQDPEEDS